MCIRSPKVSGRRSPMRTGRPLRRVPSPWLTKVMCPSSSKMITCSAAIPRPVSRRVAWGLLPTLMTLVRQTSSSRGLAAGGAPTSRTMSLTSIQKLLRPATGCEPGIRRRGSCLSSQCSVMLARTCKLQMCSRPTLRRRNLDVPGVRHKREAENFPGSAALDATP